MTGADKIQIPSQSQNMGSKNGNILVSALIDPGVSIKWTGTKGAVSGTIKKDPDGLDAIYGEGGSSGHFFPVKFDEKYYNKPIKLTGSKNGNKTIAPSSDDPYLIIRLENLSGNTATATVDGTDEEVFELDFSGATQEP